MRKTLAVLLAASVQTQAAPVHRGKASINYYPGRGYVTAARGVHRGAWLSVWDPKHPNRKIKVRVCDACGGRMAGWGRILDLSPRTFKRLYGSTGRGVAPVRYVVIKDGKGQYCGHR